LISAATADRFFLFWHLLLNLPGALHAKAT
jgi:hypothetical protein